LEALDEDGVLSRNKEVEAADGKGHVLRDDFFFSRNFAVD
jgi:hypothetical protein